MLKNYLLVAWRNLVRNKAFSAINILGLALGLTCSLLILLWVKDERGMDHFSSYSGRLYNVYERQYYDNKVEASNSTPGVLADEMRRVLPAVQLATGMAWESLNTFQVGDKVMKENGNYAGADFFKMFDYPLLQGDAAHALTTPVSIAISRKMAADFFGSPEAAMGKSLQYQNRKSVTVTAVFADQAENMSEKFDYVLNWQTMQEENEWAKDWGNNGPRAYVVLRAGTDPAVFEKSITHFLDAYRKSTGKGFRIELDIQRFDDTYLHSNFTHGQLEGGRIEYVNLFSWVAVFVLLIACINFMNLTTARSIKRAREIGVRKVVGAFRWSLIVQFIGEALLLTFIAVGAAVMLIILLFPAFNQLMHKQMVLPLMDPHSWAALLALALGTGLLAGSYPALYLSSFRAAKVLKSLPKFSTGTLMFRKGLVVFQFVLSLLLIIGTIVVSKQVAYLRTKDLGFDRQNLIYIPAEGNLIKQYELLKQEALQMPGISAVTRLSQPPTLMQNGTRMVDWDGKVPDSKPRFVQAAVGYDYLKTMNIRLLEGRDFSPAFPTDSTGYVINEQALAKIGYKNPIGRRLNFWGHNGKIIGVVRDFHFNSLKAPIDPLILWLGDTLSYGNILVKTRPGATGEALTSLEKICKQINPAFPFTYYFADEEYLKLYTGEAMVEKLADCFAFLAIFISCLGLLGLAIFTAGQRTREIGIRKVLGASVASLFSLLSAEFLVLVLIALLIASPVAWILMHKWLQNYTYQTTLSWWILAAAGLSAILIALLTVGFQAIKVARANPVKSLRTD